MTGRKPLGAHYWKPGLLGIGLILTFFAGALNLGCGATSPYPNPIKVSAGSPLNQENTFPATLTPFQPVINPTKTPTNIPPTAQPALHVWMDPNLPDGMQSVIQVPAGMEVTDQIDEADITLQPHHPKTNAQKTVESVKWVYALVTAFPNLLDEITGDQLKALWSGQPPEELAGKTIILTQKTLTGLQSILGEDNADFVKIFPPDLLLEQAWQDRNALAVVPFEEIEPRWKVVKIDGVSPLQREFNPDGYMLSVSYDLSLGNLAEKRLGDDLMTTVAAFKLPTINRDPEQLTILVMTGVTALARATAWKMDTLGVDYPASDIQGWLQDADVTHISNEVSFTEDCSKGDPGQVSLRFCSRPEYIQLLEDVGADVIELTGNHNLDWGPEAALNSLRMYQERGMRVFGGGANLSQAQTPAIVDDHGNRLAFIGCNAAGPQPAWATDQTPGALKCDMDWMRQEVRDLREQGLLPIVTFQYPESYDPQPLPAQQADFQSMAQAGAVIVSGSQAHRPQGMTFVGQSFVHYGLGNLFFDQMHVIVNDQEMFGTRDEFIDRHFFYQGRYIGTELLTAILEDYARPRPTTADERMRLLSEMFQVSGW